MTGFVHKLPGSHFRSKSGSLGTSSKTKENKISWFGFLSLQQRSTSLDLGSGGCSQPLVSYLLLPSTPIPHECTIRCHDWKEQNFISRGVGEGNSVLTRLGSYTPCKERREPKIWSRQTFWFLLSSSKMLCLPTVTYTQDSHWWIIENPLWKWFVKIISGKSKFLASEVFIST